MGKDTEQNPGFLPQGWGQEAFIYHHSAHPASFHGESKGDIWEAEPGFLLHPQLTKIGQSSYLTCFYRIMYLSSPLPSSPNTLNPSLKSFSKNQSIQGGPGLAQGGTMPGRQPLPPSAPVLLEMFCHHQMSCCCSGKGSGFTMGRW